MKTKQLPEKIKLYYPRIGSAAVVINEDKILLGVRAKEPNRGKWILPGGKVEPFETIKDAIHRELIEETGLYCKVGKQIGAYEIIVNPKEHRVIVYSWAFPEQGTLIASSDISDVRFFSKAEVARLDVTPIVREVLIDIGWL